MNLALTWLVLLGAIVLVLLPVWAATLVWVYRDAEKLGKPGILVALLVGLICWPVGLLVWLILRADYLKAKAPAPPRVCPRCGLALSSETAHGLCPACLLQQVTASESGAPNPSTFTPPTVAELAPLFPQLEILELLGRGGMGAVYKARQPGLDRFVALKVLPATTGADPSFAERFQREARALAALNHPHIVAVYDFGQLPTLSYFVMEYVDGVNLRQLERTARLSPREALAIVPQVCEALQFAHDRGIVHRDIKPENILVDKQGRVKIADFGLAKLLRVEPGGFALTETRHAIGTPQYMAPEQVEKPQSVDHRADIYSLGVVFYEMLTGELPMGRFPSPSQRVQVDVRLDEVVLKALEKEPDRRYQQASAFKTKVETYATSSAVPTGRDEPPVVPSGPTFSWTGKFPLSRGSRIFLDVVAAVLLLLAALLAGLILNSNRTDLTGPILSVISCLATAASLVSYGRWPRRSVLPTASSPPPVTPPMPAPSLAALSPGQRAGLFGARVLFVMAVLVFLWPVLGLIMDFNDPGHGPRFAICWVIAAVIAALGRVLQLLAAPSAPPPVNQSLTAPPLVQKKSRWWVWLLLVPVAGVLVALDGISLLLFARPADRPVPAAMLDAPLVLEFEIRHAGTNLSAQLQLVAGQRAFTDIIRLPHASYGVNGSVWPDREGRYRLELTLRKHPDSGDSSSFHQFVYDGVAFWTGRFGGDDFRLTLRRTGPPATPASTVTKRMDLKPVWWILLAVVIAGLVWVVVAKRNRNWHWIVLTMGVGAVPLLVWLLMAKDYREYGPGWLAACTSTELAALKLADGSLQRERTQGSYNDKDVWNFMVRTGADLRVHRQDGAWWLLMRDGRLSEVVDENWRKPQREVIAKVMAAYAHEGTMMEGHHGYKLSGALPATYAFRTAEGGLGVLQVEGEQTGGPTDQKGKLHIAVKTFPAR